MLNKSNGYDTKSVKHRAMGGFETAIISAKVPTFGG